MVNEDLETLRKWLSRCLPPQFFSLKSARDIGGKSDCRVWECDLGNESVILKIYSPGFDDYSQLGPIDTMRKHALALMELPKFGVPTPRCLGLAVEGEEAALVMEKITPLPFTHVHRVEATRVLARLHNIELRDLKHELADLISRSTPNRGRVGEAPGEPPLRKITLQHGDYFSVNISLAGASPCPTSKIRVLDWDLVALGDPMWDLGFLVSADREVTAREAEEVIAAYKKIRKVDDERLAWQRACWREFWRKRDERQYSKSKSP